METASRRMTPKLAWAAGVMCVMGSFYTNSAGRPTYSVKSTMYRQSVDEFARIIGVEVQQTMARGVPCARIVVSGANLEALMEQLKPGLTEARWAEYDYVLLQAGEFRKAKRQALEAARLAAGRRLGSDGRIR